MLVGVCGIFGVLVGVWYSMVRWLSGILSMVGVCGILGLVGWCVVFYGWRCVVFLFHEISGSGHLILVLGFDIWWHWVGCLLLDRSVSLQFN